jgi:hypothetical protein
MNNRRARAILRGIVHVSMGAALAGVCFASLGILSCWAQSSDADQSSHGEQKHQEPAEQSHESVASKDDANESAEVGSTESAEHSESLSDSPVAPKKSHGDKAKKASKPNLTPAAIPGGDPRGAVDLVVCSQNLKLFGTAKRSMASGAKGALEKHQQKIRDLVSRFMSVGCDVIAVQEVIATNEMMAIEVVQQLAQELRRRTNRFFEVVVAPPVEGQMTNAFLLAKDRVQLQHQLPYGRVELPKISKKQRPRLFSRPPLEVQLSVKARDSEMTKPVSLVNFHFKSKRGGKDDPTGMEWETYRMEMGEALRRIVEMRHKDAFASGESLLLLLGDRNSNFDVASARVLEGSLLLSSFAEKGACRMSKRGLPLCVAQSALPRKLFSVLTNTDTLQVFPGTFNYNGEYSWLDDILMPAESLRFAWRTAFSEGEYDAGLVQTPIDASDHAMVYVKLNW